MDISPAELQAPIAPGIVEVRFVSKFDNTQQTFLQVDHRTTKSGKAAPLVVIYLHGAASHQDQGMTSGIYKRAFDRWNRELVDRQAIYICPEYRGGSWMGPAAEADLTEILQLVRENYDVGQLILTGGSMGGTSSLIFASRHPDSVDGVIALCPATDPAAMFGAFSEQFLASYGGSPQDVSERYEERRSRDRASALAKIPIAIVHGADDTVIPVEHSQVLVERLQDEKAHVLYIEMPGGDHDAPLDVSVSELFDFVCRDGVENRA